jgi:hypothetical protein
MPNLKFHSSDKPSKQANDGSTTLGESMSKIKISLKRPLLQNAKVFESPFWREERELKAGKQKS